MQPGDVPVTYADTEPLERDYGYKPSTDLRTGASQICPLVQGVLQGLIYMFIYNVSPADAGRKKSYLRFFSRVGFCNISFKLYLQIFVQNMLSMPAKVIS